MKEQLVSSNWFPLNYSIKPRSNFTVAMHSTLRNIAFIFYFNDVGQRLFRNYKNMDFYVNKILSQY